MCCHILVKKFPVMRLGWDSLQVSFVISKGVLVLGYVISYGPEVPESVPVRPFRGYWLFVILAFGVAGLWLRGPVGDRVFPWRQEAVQSAYGEFREAVVEGEPFGVALEAFCRDLLSNEEPFS